jgi:spermidine synthase
VAQVASDALGVPHLTDTRALTDIHVVDISREILEMSAVVFAPAANPLADPRVRLHVEDGRFFLQTSPESFDLITGEPPPPKAAGIVS